MEVGGLSILRAAEFCALITGSALKFSIKSRLNFCSKTAILAMYLIVVFALYMMVYFANANNHIPPLILGVRTIG